MRVYIGMPISNHRDYDPQQMFKQVAELVRSHGLEPISPMDFMNPEIWPRLLEQMNFREACKQLVQSDLSLLKQSDAIIAIMARASIGTSMELLYARLWGKTTVLVTGYQNLYHPWLWYHSDKVIYSEDLFGDGVTRACIWLNEHRAPPNG
ncbi:MAG: hypothetical protein KatS3mg023_3762 [Armatimonadota bacterium]|nr:MAG: hypothetical protein KatS3mg023_3762 [Armatimonadota bacterium]